MIRKRRPSGAAARRLRSRTAGKPRRAGTARRPLRGYRAGHAAGYAAGLNHGRNSFGAQFEGTSIIIPSYNQVDFLKRCIASIAEHTRLPHEIIVVDNASADGTADFLRKEGGPIRYRLLEANRGFAGAVNIGMMMAKGTTMLLLNNDTLVTERWLDNLLACLNSDPSIGMVGPLTNYIGGEQQIEVPYTDVRDMPAFAAAFNTPDSGKWRRTDRLPGFCLLFRRELWEKIGYLDEGYAVGNFEDDDFNVRVRLQGYSLVIAGDTFIHHFGSVSMKALGESYETVNERNLHFYADKWGNPHELVSRVRTLAGAEGASAAPAAGETAFYPEGVIVRGVGPAIYWIEAGCRRPIEGETPLPVTKLSQVDLRRWPIGPAISAAEAEALWHGRRPAGAGEGGRGAAAEAGTAVGRTAIGPDGSLVVVDRGLRRSIASRAAAEAWGLHLKPPLGAPQSDIALLAEGLPVIAPVRVAPNL